MSEREEIEQLRKHITNLREMIEGWRQAYKELQKEKIILEIKQKQNLHTQKKGTSNNE